MSDTQLRQNGSLHTPFEIPSVRIEKISGSEGVLEATSSQTGPKPSRESPEPDPHLVPDFDSLPSLTNGSSRGSRTPCSSVVADLEHSTWTAVTTAAMPCSYDSQPMTRPNSPASPPYGSGATNEATRTSPRALDHRDQVVDNGRTRLPQRETITPRNSHNCTVATAVVTKPLRLAEIPEAENSDEESLIDSVDLDDEDNADEDSNDSWSLHIHILETAALKAFRNDLNLAAFILNNIKQILGLRNSRDLSKQKVDSWIPCINKYSPNSSENSSGKTESSYASQSTDNSAGQSKKRLRSANQKHQDGRGDRGEDGDDQQDRDPKKFKEGGPWDKFDEGPLLACPFWKQDPSKYNKHYHPDANSRRGKYQKCEGPGFSNLQRLKEHLMRVHTHVQCQRCGTVFDGSDENTRAKRLEEHVRHPKPCQLRTEIVKEGISDAQWTALRKQASNKGKGNSCPLPKTTVEKWNDIWAVLFANLSPPKNPWHPREDPQIQPLVLEDSPLGSFRRLFEQVLHEKVQTGDISMNEVTISQVVDVAAQTLVLSQGIQDLNLGTSSGLPHSSDYSYLGGSYMEIPPTTADTVIQDPNMNQLSELNTSSQRAPQHDMAPGTRTDGSPVANVDQMYAQGLDPHAMARLNNNSGDMSQYEPFHSSTSMQRTMSVPYIQAFGQTSSFNNGFQLGEKSRYAISSNGFYNSGLDSYGNGSPNNGGIVPYRSLTAIQPSAATQYGNLGEFRPPHDQRR